MRKDTMTSIFHVYRLTILKMELIYKNKYTPWSGMNISQEYKVDLIFQNQPI